MTQPYNLHEMDPNSFEHMANALAIRVLGSGVTTFGPGADGGRDGWFQGEAEYPNSIDRWSGEWYIQSKYHRINLSGDHNKWLLSQIKIEVKKFQEEENRDWPDNWIIITNIDYSATPRTGVFDAVRALLKKSCPKLADRFSIWGGEKVRALLTQYPEVARHYGSFITPGNILASLFDSLQDQKASIKDIVRYLIVTQFTDQQFTKLEQAGSSSDNRPGIHKLFRDIPFRVKEYDEENMAAQTLAKSLAQNHRIDDSMSLQAWSDWQRNPSRARVWFIKGGPGQGKSTVTQYICQVQRAAWIAGDTSIRVPPKTRTIVNEVKDVASRSGIWPADPRIPVLLELKEFSEWISKNNEGGNSILSYLSNQIRESSAQKTLATTLRQAFSSARWIFVFDGMDEVPGDVKENVAKEINYFVDDLLVDCNCDAQIICTSRPQGYSGQFDSLDAADIRLSSLNSEQALRCAQPILEIDRSVTEGERFVGILKEALSSRAIREIMTTPLQAHIMAVVVRDGGRPPERKWELFSNFYKVINKREADKSADKKLSALLRGHAKLIKALHNRLGFELHARAEVASGAQSSLERDQLLQIIRETVLTYQNSNVEETVNTLCEATTDRLVLVNTPESSNAVRFDIRPLQEFFAAEYIYETASFEYLTRRVKIIASDSHWREVLHFVLSALIENERRSDLAQVVQVISEVDEPARLELRPYTRRLAIGAQIVSRLLQEGVLEEDRRIRQAFKNNLVPILGTTDIWSDVLKVDREHSKKWILELVREVLLFNVESENIGAAAVACCLFDYGMDHAQEVHDAILSSTMGYRSGIFDMLFDSIQLTPWRLAGGDLNYFRLSTWGRILIMRTLLDPKWAELGLDSLEKAFEMISLSRAEREGAADYLSEMGFSAEANIIIATILEQPRFGRRAPTGKRERDYGIAKVILLPPAKRLNFLSWGEGLFDELVSAGGFLRLSAILMKAVSMGPIGSSWLKNSYGHELRDLRYLPNALHPYLSPDFLRNPWLYHGEGAGELAILNHKDIGESKNFIFMHFDRDQIVDGQIEWREFFRDYPEIAVQMVVMTGGGYRQKEIGAFFNEDQNCLLFLDILRSYPGVVLQFARSWGSFIRNIPRYEAELRDIFMQAVSVADLPRHFLGERCDPIALNLPIESPLLPYVLASLIGEFLFEDFEPQRPARDHKGRVTQVKAIVSKIIMISTDLEALSRIYDDDSNSRSVRAAAYVSYLFVKSESNMVSLDEARTLCGLYQPGADSWLLAAIGFVLSTAIENGRENIQECFAQVLHASRADYKSRIDIGIVLRRWRELTSAPVSNSEPIVWQVNEE